jgi:FAD/FMN-containing dehydrogenase
MLESKTEMNTLNPNAIHDLRERVAGQVVLPGDPGYDPARFTWNAIVDQHPALVVMAAEAGDVAAAVRFAAGHDLDIAVQGTGHGTIRPADGALLINTAGMAGVAVDPQARTARINAGTKWGQVLPEAQAHGLAPLLGSSPTVGAIGYTLGGGLGWLGRKYGLATDSVVSFDVVTADGEERTVSADENPDLFWGLRGGGGSLAAVTAMTVRLFPVQTVYGGVLIYPAPLAADVLRRWRDWIKELPDEMTSAVKIINVPDMDIAPEPLRGQTVAILEGCYCGPLEEGEALIKTWRDWQTPMLDMFGPMPFSQVAQISQDPADPMPSFVTTEWLRELPDEAVATITRYATLQAGRVPLIFIEVRHAGGTISRGRPEDSAFGHRDAELLLEAVGIVPEPPLWEVLSDYTSRLRADLRPWLAGKVYMNFLEGAESVARVRDGFPAETFARLSALKAKYDPHNRFNRAMAIPPAG